VATVRAAVGGDLDEFTRLGQWPPVRLVAGIAADGIAVGPGVILVGRGGEALFARRRIRVLIATEAGFKAVDLYVALFEFLVEALILGLKFGHAVLELLNHGDEVFDRVVR
jgi:hypothetical protein